MKINKNTSVVCIVASILTGAALFIPNLMLSVQGIVSNIFTGFVVSIVIALVGYFHERNRIIDRIDTNLRSLFINMNVLSKIIGSILVRIHASTNLSDLQFGRIPSMSGLNIQFIDNMELGLFDAFLQRSALANVHRELVSFQAKAFNVKNIASDLEASSLEHTITLLTIQANQMKGIQSSREEQIALESAKNTIIIRTAKLHEYETSLTIKIEAIADKFYKCSKKKQKWNDVKRSLQIQIEDIIKG